MRVSRQSPRKKNGFTDEQRGRMLALKGVGNTVVDRLEEVGYRSLHELAEEGPEQVTRRIAESLGTTCWRNSPQARNAIAAIIALAKEVKHDG